MTRDSIMIDQAELERDIAVSRLTGIALLTLGYIVGREGFDAFPVYPLAQALKDLKIESHYIDAILKRGPPRDAKT